jgi:hypothetical protein
MDRLMNCARVLATAALAAVSLSSIAVAKPAAGRGGRGGPAVVSPEVLTDGRITFRVLAPDAAKVTFVDSDGITSSSSLGPPPAGGTALAKNQNGIWEATYGPLPAGAYRYAFQVDGVNDGLITNTRTTVEFLKKHGFEPVFKESPGVYSWLNWRYYLIEFAPQLF